MKNKKILLVAFAILILIVVWSITIDKVYIIEGCNDCLYNKQIVQYRFLTFPISIKEVENHSSVEIIARDIGAPCPHNDHYKHIRQKWWGLFYCSSPCMSGTTGLTTDLSWYTKEIQSKLVDLSKDPNFVNEFFERTIINHDMVFFRDFLENLLQEEH